jgi:hypothetical protein
MYILHLLNYGGNGRLSTVFTVGAIYISAAKSIGEALFAAI